MAALSEGTRDLGGGGPAAIRRGGSRGWLIALLLLSGCSVIPGIRKSGPLLPDPAIDAGPAAADTTRAPDPEGIAPVETVPPSPARPPAVRVAIPEMERARLTAEVNRDLRIGEQSLEAASRRDLSPEETETAAALRQLISDAQQTRDAGDLRTAARLASKARILAGMLAAR